MDYAKLFQFYKQLQERLTQAGLSYRLIGGQAAVLYKFAEFTKDCDLNIGIDGAPIFLKILSEVTAQFSTQTPATVSYRFGLGSPVDARWGMHGWTSHFEITTSDIHPRIDLFMQLPRVDSRFNFQAGVSELNILAETKKTQREKDWDFVKSIGLKMLERGDPLGFLHIFDHTILTDFVAKNQRPSTNLVTLRPALGLIDTNIQLLEPALQIERLFWQKWDAVRLKRYVEGGRNYFSEIRKVTKQLAGEPLSIQHQALIGIAEQYLPPNPFTKPSVSELIQQIVTELFTGFPSSFRAYLPNLDLIVHDDGVYNPMSW
jgi:hypothetical protein